MNLHHVHAIIRKQRKDTLRNKPTLVQFVMFPAIAAVLTYLPVIYSCRPDTL